MLRLYRRIVFCRNSAGVTDSNVHPVCMPATTEWGEGRRQDCLVLRIAVASSRIFFTDGFFSRSSLLILIQSIIVRYLYEYFPTEPVSFRNVSRALAYRPARGGVGDLARETDRRGQTSIDRGKSPITICIRVGGGVLEFLITF